MPSTGRQANNYEQLNPPLVHGVYVLFSSAYKHGFLMGPGKRREGAEGVPHSNARGFNIYAPALQQDPDGQINRKRGIMTAACRYMVSRQCMTHMVWTTFLNSRQKAIIILALGRISKGLPEILSLPHNVLHGISIMRKMIRHPLSLNHIG